MPGVVELKQLDKSLEATGALRKKGSKGSKDMRSFRPSTVKELNAAMNYHPVTINRDGEEVPILFGCDWLDWWTVWGGLLSLWSFVLCLFALLMKANLDTEGPSAALWIFFFAYIFFAAAVYAGVVTGQWERARNETKEAAQLEAAAADEDEDEAPLVDFSSAIAEQESKNQEADESKSGVLVVVDHEREQML